MRTKCSRLKTHSPCPLCGALCLCEGHHRGIASPLPSAWQLVSMPVSSSSRWTSSSLERTLEWMDVLPRSSHRPQLRRKVYDGADRGCAPLYRELAGGVCYAPKPSVCTSAGRKGSRYTSVAIPGEAIEGTMGSSPLVVALEVGPVFSVGRHDLRWRFSVRRSRC